jgi:hypothetical protein
MIRMEMAGRSDNPKSANTRRMKVVKRESNSATAKSWCNDNQNQWQLLGKSMAATASKEGFLWSILSRLHLLIQPIPPSTVFTDGKTWVKRACSTQKPFCWIGGRLTPTLCNNHGSHTKRVEILNQIFRNIRNIGGSGRCLPLWMKWTGRNSPGCRLPSPEQQAVDHLLAEPEVAGFPVSSTAPCSFRRMIRPTLERCANGSSHEGIK